MHKAAARCCEKATLLEGIQVFNSSMVGQAASGLGRAWPHFPETRGLQIRRMNFGEAQKLLLTGFGNSHTLPPTLLKPVVSEGIFQAAF
jgi:hypothetical protein